LATICRAHELRTPLNAYLWGARCCGRGAGRADPKNAALETIERNARGPKKNVLIDRSFSTFHVIVTRQDESRDHAGSITPVGERRWKRWRQEAAGQESYGGPLLDTAVAATGRGGFCTVDRNCLQLLSMPSVTHRAARKVDVVPRESQTAAEAEEISVGPATVGRGGINGIFLPSFRRSCQEGRVYSRPEVGLGDGAGDCQASRGAACGIRGSVHEGGGGGVRGRESSCGYLRVGAARGGGAADRGGGRPTDPSSMLDGGFAFGGDD